MSVWAYLILLVVAFVGMAVWLDVRWSSYRQECAACVAAGRLAELVAESDAEIRRAARDEETLRVAGLVSVAPVIQFPEQRGPGSGS